MQIEDWPSGDRVAWMAARRPSRALRSSSTVQRWSAASWTLAERGHGRWLAHLAARGELDISVPPDARVTVSAVEDYFAAMEAEGLGGFTIALYVEGLGNALRALAPSGDWKWIARAAQRIRADAVSVRDIEARMRPPEDILQLGLQMMDAAEEDGFASPIDRAIFFRDGLLLALAVHRPFRSKNLASLVPGENLVRRGDGWAVSFASGEMKNRRRYECSWPQRLEAPLERYMEVHRAVLLKGSKGGSAALRELFVTRNGTPISQQGIIQRVSSRTRNRFGTAINPHTFRHIDATTMASVDPENITDAPRLLGHARVETSEQYYNLAKMEAASIRYQAVLRGLTRRRGRSKAG